MSNTTTKTKFKMKRNIKPTTIKTSITDKTSKTSTVKGFKIIGLTTDTITTKTTTIQPIETTCTVDIVKTKTKSATKPIPSLVNTYNREPMSLGRTFFNLLIEIMAKVCQK
jgi:hypothetical protein